MNKFFKKLKKNWIIVWLIIAIISTSVFVTYAAYTGIAYVKRVVSTKASTGALFSSNSMQMYTGSIPTRHITTSQSSGNHTYNLTVCDFAQSDPLTRYISDNGITYNLTAQLYVKINGIYYPVNDNSVSQTIKDDAASRTYSIQYVSNGGTNVDPTPSVISLSDGHEETFSSHVILPSGNGTNKYSIVFDEYELGDSQTYDYFIKLTATPTNEDGSLSRIACYLYLTKYVTVNSTWSGRLMETSNISNYDSYNYILEGSGDGTVTVRWNSSFIDVNEIFIDQQNLSVTTEDADANGHIWKYFDMSVDNDINHYQIQLYKNNASGDYSNVLNYISCSYSSN